MLIVRYPEIQGGRASVHGAEAMPEAFLEEHLLSAPGTYGAEGTRKNGTPTVQRQDIRWVRLPSDVLERSQGTPRTGPRTGVRLIRRIRLTKMPRPGSRTGARTGVRLSPTHPAHGGVKMCKHLTFGPRTDPRTGARTRTRFTPIRPIQGCQTLQNSALEPRTQPRT